MRGETIYRNEKVTVLNVHHNRWKNRIEYLIIHDYQTKWVGEECVGRVVWLIG